MATDVRNENQKHEKRRENKTEVNNVTTASE